METKIPQPQPIAPSLVQPSDDPYLIVRQAHTPASIDTESKLEEVEICYHNGMAMRTQPTLSPGMSTRIAEATALSPFSFCKRYRSSYKTPSPSSSLTLLIRKRYQEEEEEEAAPEGQQQAVPVVDTTANEPLELGYEALRRRELALGEGLVPSTFEIRQSSSLCQSSRGSSYPVVVHQRQPRPATIAVVRMSSPCIIHKRLDALPPALFEGYDRDLKELYTRPVLAFESWAGHVDAHRVEMWRARYDDHSYLHRYGVWKQSIRRIGNWSNALSCEVLALIRRISFVRYGSRRKRQKRRRRKEEEEEDEERCRRRKREKRKKEKKIERKKRGRRETGGGTIEKRRKRKSRRRRKKSRRRRKEKIEEER
ncbi:hypothetical protein Tco_0360035 [Tanacetum coccineum]